MTSLPAEAFARADALAAAGSAAAQPREPHPYYASAPSGELADIYAIALIALPLALFLRWLWP